MPTIPVIIFQPSPKSYNSQTLGPKQTHFQSQELKPWPPPFNSTLACSTPPPSAPAWATTWQSSTSFQRAAVPVASRWRYIKCIGAWGVDPPQQVTHCSSITNPYKFTNLCLLEQVDMDSLPHSEHRWLSSTDRNFLAKMTHGNRRGKGLKIIHWNKGPSFLRNKH